MTVFFTSALMVWATLAHYVQCLEKRAWTQSPQYMAPLFDQTTQQVCGWITADVNNPFACWDQYCSTISGYFACCASVTSSYSSYSYVSTYTYTLSLTASDTTHDVNTFAGSQIQYSYQSCNYYTTCYPSYSASLCTADCASNVQNLICTGSEFPYCQVLTMAHEFPNTTYTSFQCAQASSDTVALYNEWNTPINTAAAASTSSSSWSHTYNSSNPTPTSVSQSSIPATAGATITNMPSPTSGAIRHSLPHGACILLAMLLSM